MENYKDSGETVRGTGQEQVIEYNHYKAGNEWKNTEIVKINEFYQRIYVIVKNSDINKYFKICCLPIMSNAVGLHEGRFHYRVYLYLTAGYNIEYLKRNSGKYTKRCIKINDDWLRGWKICCYIARRMD